eukprot:TRINITY_DN1581_c0_g1_i1.p1 TRINITY_DN1581_c0_g1~~TRINITY_DN1581_c0_g1_i1.p1  ORF type:complete len:389 (+),score=137.07 TRINITY_DN1581_c0_g1_i1:66-1169(+)
MSGKAKAPAKASAPAAKKSLKIQKKEAKSRQKVNKGKSKAAAAKPTGKPEYNRPAAFPHLVPFNFSRALKTRKAVAKAFINKLLGIKVAGDLETALRSGVILAKVLNKVKENSVQFKDGDKLDFATSRANLLSFAKAAKALGVFTFRPRDLLNGDHFNAVLRTVEELRALAYKNGKLQAPKKAPRARTSFSRGVPARRVAVAARQAKKAKKGKKADAKPQAQVVNVVDAVDTQFSFKYKPHPVVLRPQPTIAREAYLSNLQTEAIPESFLLKLMSEETLHHGLVVIGFTQGLKQIIAGKEYIVSPRGSTSHKTIAFTFLEFLGYKLIPTTKRAGGHLVKADEARKTLAARLLKLFVAANKNANGIKL